MWEFIRAGGPFMWLLLLMSIVSVAFIIERAIALRWQKVIPPVVEATVESCRTAVDLKVLHQICQQHSSPLSRLLLVGVRNMKWSKAENLDAIETRARKEVTHLERGLVIIEVIVGTAPLLGLVGTLHGLITLFGDFSQASVGDNAALAKGISIALNTTLTGLLIAIPSLIAWSYFNKKVETVAVEMETLCDELLHRCYDDGSDILGSIRSGVQEDPYSVS